MMLQAEQAVCGLLRLLVRVEGGAEAVCLRDGAGGFGVTAAGTRGL